MEKKNVYGEMISIGSKFVEEKKIEDGMILYPMLRVEDEILKIAIMIETKDEKLWNEKKMKRPHYWATFDINDKSLIELNDAYTKDYMKTDNIPLDLEYEDPWRIKNEEFDKFIIDKQIQYKEYLLKDIKQELNNYSDILDAVDNKLIIDNEKVDAKDYILANIEDEVVEKAKDLTELVATGAFSFIDKYYQTIWNEIREEYIESGTINREKMDLASNIMDKYYGDKYGIKDLFNN